MLASTLRAAYVTIATAARRAAIPLGTAACSALLAAACAARPAATIATAPPPAASPRLTVRRDSAIAPVTAIAASIPEPTPRALLLSTADELVGTRYRYGGSSPKRGFDCSGFVRWVYAQQGIDLPRTAGAMARAGTRVPARRTELAPGDLLLFAVSGSRISHVAIYVGDGRIVHASSGQGEVRYDDLDSARGRWFRRHVVSARRVIATRDEACVESACQAPGARR
jgi:cell wall-associated NlpC family hydrolase